MAVKVCISSLMSPTFDLLLQLDRIHWSVLLPLLLFAPLFLQSELVQIVLVTLLLERVCETETRGLQAQVTGLLPASGRKL